jgi:hypothetical protein
MLYFLNLRQFKMIAEKIESKNVNISSSLVTKFLNNYRDALTKLIPIFDKQEIDWKNSDDSEEFEGIAESLYQWMVIYKIEDIIVREHDFLPKIVKYGYVYHDYSERNFIEVIHKNEDHFGILVFDYFKTKQQAFDTVQCTKITFESNELVERQIELPFNEVSFNFQCRIK